MDAKISAPARPVCVHAQPDVYRRADAVAGVDAFLRQHRCGHRMPRALAGDGEGGAVGGAPTGSAIRRCLPRIQADGPALAWKSSTLMAAADSTFSFHRRFAYQI